MTEHEIERSSRTNRPDGDTGRGAGMLALAILASVLMLAARNVPGRAAAVWTRLDLVENTAEGPAFDRCAIEADLKKGETARWQVFYGEARADSGSGWSAIRSSSGCARAGTEPAAPAWDLTGSPYFLVGVALGEARVVDDAILMDAELSIRTLTGFAADGSPVDETRTEKRIVRIPENGSAVVPILVASAREADEFRVHELLLRFRAHVADVRSSVKYGELAVTADVPRAEVFLDGGYVGRISADAPVVLEAVRAGDREVVVRDASGRETRTVARVEKGRRTAVSLALMKETAASAGGLRPLGRNPQGAEEFWREKDGAIVVRIPGGEFQMGVPVTEGDESEKARHVVRVGGFLMDKTEVTWGQYARFLAATGQPAPKTPVWGTPEALPVSNVTWDEAHAFCDWVGGRLPTEAEWEHAARGDDARTYPWGNTFDPWRCNTRDGGPHEPTPAGSYPDCVSPQGVLDMSGSVAEWCSDWYAKEYDVGNRNDNPTGPETGTTRVVRGGNWMSAATAVRATYRLGIEPAWPGPMQGFRCAQDDRKPCIGPGQAGSIPSRTSAGQ